jgi:hypothetical protein
MEETITTLFNLWGKYLGGPKGSCIVFEFYVLGDYINETQVHYKCNEARLQSMAVIEHITAHLMSLRPPEEIMKL